jgi:translation initiation factor 6 (eIF-6)
VANIQKIGTCEVEKEDYYSKCFSGTPSVVTNKGCLELPNTNIDLIQIIQQG